MEYLADLAREGRRTLIDFPDCPGCQTFAEQREDVAEVAREALEGWLEVHLEGGEAPPRPSARKHGAKTLAVRVNPALAIALQLRWRRQDLNLSQSDLGKRLGVSRQQVALLERPGGNLRVSTLARAAEALNVKLDIVLLPSVPRRTVASRSKVAR
jgi:predicted RNase H-like HicB family nuclease/DNA-binding XRE family transcriptional regulator